MVKIHQTVAVGSRREGDGGAQGHSQSIYSSFVHCRYCRKTRRFKLKQGQNAWMFAYVRQRLWYYTELTHDILRKYKDIDLMMPNSLQEVNVRRYVNA